MSIQEEQFDRLRQIGETAAKGARNSAVALEAIQERVDAAASQVEARAATVDANVAKILFWVRLWWIVAIAFFILSLFI